MLYKLCVTYKIYKIPNWKIFFNYKNVARQTATRPDLHRVSEEGGQVSSFPELSHHGFPRPEPGGAGQGGVPRTLPDPAVPVPPEPGPPSLTGRSTAQQRPLSPVSMATTLFPLQKPARNLARTASQ